MDTVLGCVGDGQARELIAKGICDRAVRPAPAGVDGFHPGLLVPAPEGEAGASHGVDERPRNYGSWAVGMTDALPGRVHRFEHPSELCALQLPEALQLRWMAVEDERRHFIRGEEGRWVGHVVTSKARASSRTRQLWI